MRSLINRFFSKAMLLAALGVTVGGAQAQFNMTLDVTPRAGVTATKGSIVLPTIVPPFTNKMEIASGAVPMVAVVSNGWRFVGWQLVAGDGAFDDSTQTNTTYYYNFQTSASIRAVFGESLTITSTNRDGALVGNPQPFGGASYDDPASSILTTNLVPFRLWVTTPWPLTATEQAICTGFKAAGILPATSILTSNSVSITTNTTIDWQWSSQYGMNVTTNPAGGGTVTRSNPGPWYNPGDTVTLTATPGFGYNFSGWSGDTNGATSLIVTPAVGTLTMVMNSGHAVLASFVSKSAVNLTIVSTVPAYGPVGAPQPWSGTQATNNGAYITASVTTPFSGGVIPAGIREMLVTPVSWTGTGSLPGSGAGNSATFTITNDTSVTWNWVEQYKLTINTNFAPGSGGYVTHTPAGAPGNDMWYTNGVTVIMQAFPDANSTIAGWGGTVDDSTLELTNSVVISGPPAQSVDINFVPKSSERMIWFANFGLNENAPPYSDRGLHGDPDGDGIDNQGEYLISMQAASNGIAIPSSPVHCDSDGDSMDDGYEFHYIINTNAPGQGGQQKNGIAVVWPNDNFGTNGNTDGDFHWSTTNGYLTTQPLINIEEYKGPDGVAPYNFESIAAGGVSSDGWTNSLSSRTVVRRVVNPADSADTSFSDTRFTSGDSMDDGFKWSWDTWQKNNAGMLIAGTNWTAITNTVPSWTQVRIFKPSVIFLEPDAYGFPRGYPAYDVWYNPDDGQRLDNYVTIMQKYQASALSSSNQYPVLRRYPPPFSPSWCVNPFLWDTDNDGLPDGWELTFGYDPWDRTTKGVTLPDGKGNPAGAWYAKDDGGRRHNQVYLQPKTPDGHLYDPNTGYGYAVPLAAAGPDTVEFDNLERIRGSGDGPYFPVVYTNDMPTSPYKIDSDGDGMWDGWEFYVGLNPLDPTDVTGNFEEFNSYATSTNVQAALIYLAGWQNKLMPTDPNDLDTDRDQIPDTAEMAAFNGITNGVVHVAIDTNNMTAVVTFFEGGGLDPTSADTDGDRLPDNWENMYPGALGADGVWAGGMNGTMPDAEFDYDGDGLLNYQEYLVGAVYCWQYAYNNGATAWTSGRGLYNYEPFDFFDQTLSGNDSMSGPGGRVPWSWDPNFEIGPPTSLVPWAFMTAAEPLPPGESRFSTCNPMKVDTDEDGMDDYWEVYHGISPLYGYRDIVLEKIVGRDLPPIGNPGTTDFLNQPWIAGHPLMDVDQDGLKNYEESIQKDVVGVPYYHTDPTPLWMTDFSSRDSWANLYYWSGSFSGSLNRWYWNEAVLAGTESAPTYFFSFESNEGFDTDNDNISDKAELVGDTAVTTGLTDPLDGQSPLKRRALYLNGNAAARTRDPHLATINEFRQFTVEVWARPETPADGYNQVVLERSVYIPPGSSLTTPGVRRNFRIGINAAGQPYASYDNAEGSPIVASPVAPASAVMLANEWAHLACTYGGHYDSRNNWVGYLKLYKDGELVATKTSSVIPANGWCESYNTPPALASLWFEAPIVVGAADDNPNGWVDGTTILLPPRAGLGHAPPALTNFFKGWLDHIAIWDGARSQEEVQADKLTRLTLGQVAQFATNQSLATILKAYYTFDNRPDPDHSPVSPSGFQVLNQYPATYLNVPWWANAPDKSILYDDYRYVPWIENMVAHIPLAPPRDGIGVSTNSGVVSTNEFGVVVTNGIFRNTANPYGLVYIHNSSGLYESHPQIGDRVASTDITWAMANNPTVSDLLPLRWAVTDEDVPMWDGSGTPAINDAYDTDGDGLPDWWEEKYGFDPLDASGDNGAYGDPDGDGLANIYEYICYTDPMSVDTDGNDISDLDEDFDQDGLSNREELFVYGTHPAFADTDDDGLTDGEEVNLGFAANDSRAPFIQRSLECFGNTNAPIQIHESSLAVKERESFDLSEWTLEAHVNLQSYPTNAAARLIQRVAAIGFSRPVNYELGVTTSGVAYVRYETASGQSIDLVAPSTLRFSTNEWHHIAGRLAGGVLTLFVDGKPSVELYSNLLGARDNSPDLHGTVKMGAGLTGFADELRIWSVARSDAEILASCNQTLLFKADGYGSLSVNGGTDGMVSAGLGTIECLSNQWTISTWFKLGTNSGSGILVARSATQVAGVANNIWNYYLGIDAGGKVVALHTYSYSQLNLEDGFYHNYIANNTLTSLSDVRDGEWHHAAYVWDGSRFYLYVDGLRNAVGSLPALFSSATLWRNFMTSGGSVVVGEGLTATIDETRIYNYGMSAQLLNITRMLPASLIDPGLVSAFNYDFNSGSLRIRDWAPRRDIEEYGLLVGNASLLYNVNVPDVDVDPLYAYAGVMSGYWVFDDGGRFAENMMMRTYLVSNVSDYNYEPLGGLVTNSIPPPSNLFWNSPSQFELRSGFDTDSDGDGLLDAWEVLHHLNPGNATGVNGADGDPDGDGLTNLDEYNAGTDPQNWDTDGNGVADGLEDSDGDGLSNADECNLFGTNPFLADSDDDGYDDGAEISNLKPDPADNFGIYRALTSPTDSISPFIPRSFVMSGSGLAGPELNDTARFALVYAEAANSNGPIVTITEPVSNANVAVRYLAVRGTVQSAVALQAVKLYNNGQFVISLGGVTSFDKTIILNSGTNRLEVIATDADGQQGSAQVSVNGTFARAAIRVTQNWNVAGDLDTWLVDPLGRTRGFTSSGPGLPQHVATQIPGSILDIDDIQGVGPENITIMEGLTTNGNYEVWMDNFSNQGNPQSTVRVLVLEGLPGQQYVEFGPQSMPVSDYNGNNAAAWWHVTTINMPSGTMNPPGTPLTDTPVTDTDPITGITSLVGWTIEAWMKPGTNLQSGAVAKYMLDDGRLGYCVGLSSNQPFVRLGLATGGTNQPSYQALAGQLPANVWSHVAWVYSQTENSLRIYVNGTLTVAQQLLESRAVGSGSLTVDTYDTVPGRTFTACKLDELRFWSRARNGGAVLSTMNQIVEPSKSLVACYRFDDGGRGIEDSAYYPWDQRYDLGGTNVPDLLIDAKPGPDGKWRTADDIAAGVGSDGQNDYVTCSDAAPVSGMLDSDADGLPNWWESLFGKGAGMDPAKDDDKDGLNNLYEYYVNTNPKDLDTDDDGVLDSQEDFDHDGLSNLQEQELGSRPDLTDTDDDGISDGNEAGVPYRSPTDALSPIIDRVLQVNAGGYVEMPADTRFAASSNWTVEAWVNPTNLTAATVIGRQVEANVWNYNLSLNASGQVIAMFTPGDRTANVSVTSSVAVAAGTWTHLAASFDAGSGYLSVYLNGTVRGHVYTGKRPAFSGVGPTWTRTGQGLNGSLDEVAVYSTCLSDVALQATMAGVKSQTAATPACYYRFDDGTSATNDGAGNWVGTSGKSDWNRGQVQDFAPAISLNDWNTGWQHGGTLVGSVNIALAPVDAPVNYGAMDSDSDGLTDWWEQANGLDFNNATGINGPYSDPDADGLNNLAEFKAGTNPHWADTYSFGAPDYYLWAITNKVIFGERFTDHDFMDDAWEFAHFVQDELDPQRYDAQMDADGDGWSNYAEFMAGTDPATTASHPMPSIAGTITYNGFKTGSNVVVHAYQNPDISGNPFVGTSVGLANNYWTFSLAANAPVYIASETIGTTPMQSGYFLHGNVMPGSVVIILGSSTNGVYVRDNGNGHIGNGTIDYATGAWTYPLSGTIVLGTAITASYSYNPIIGLKEGPVYLQAFMDLNANGRFDTGEPAGIAEGQPFNLEWNDLGGVGIALTDNALGYGRFSWTPLVSSLSNRVVIAGTVGPLVRAISPTRSFVDEQDFIQLGYTNGLPLGSYTWSLYQESLVRGAFTVVTNSGGTFAFSYAALAMPTLVAPVGNELRQYTRNTFKFAADGNSTVSVRLRLYSGTNAVGTPVYDATTRLPYQQADGYRYLTPANLYFGGATNLGNGSYTWTLVGINGDGSSSAASATFTVNTTLVSEETGPFTLGGTLRYYDKVTNSSFVVEASQTPSFGGIPDGQVVVQNTATTNKWPTNSFQFLMPGLPGGSYYLRAYLDQNGNRTLDPSETRGYLTSVTSFYSLATITANDLTPANKLAKTNLVIRMSSADTDNDKIPDDWEMATAGNLNSMSVGTYAIMSARGANYIMSAAEWTILNSGVGADGISVLTKLAFGMDPIAPYQFMISGVSVDADGQSHIIWACPPGSVVPTLSGARMLTANGATATYSVEYTTDFTNWTDATDGGAPLEYTNGIFRYQGMPDTAARFYRVRVAFGP